jgi:hypothetical protein
VEWRVANDLKSKNNYARPAFSPGEKENHLPLLEQNSIHGFPIFPWKSFRQTAIATRVIEDSMRVIHVPPLLGRNDSEENRR